MNDDLISRKAAIDAVDNYIGTFDAIDVNFLDGLKTAKKLMMQLPYAQRWIPVTEIEKIIESLQEQADIYNARAQELLVEEDGQVSQYTWAVSLRETYRRIIKTLDDLIS